MMRPASEAHGATLADWVEHAARCMNAAGLHFGHGTATARDEACWMASYVLGLRPDFATGEFARRLTGSERERLERLLNRRVETRKPLAYLIGEAWFAGLRFAVDERVLVPRSPIAELIVDGLDPWLDLDRPLRALEVGTGSGCIAAALAYYRPALSVDAVDVSSGALELAAANIARLGLGGRVRTFVSDVYDGLGAARYDLIVSNPPYVPAASMADLPAEYGHEPADALRAGRDGLDVVRRLIAGAEAHLNPGGFLVVEVGEARPQTEALLGRVEAVWLEFERGGEGVVLLDRNACRHWKENRS
jgi:ribosomal protein L3 glutamine methyltransferase